MGDLVQVSKTQIFLNQARILQEMQALAALKLSAFQSEEDERLAHTESGRLGDAIRAAKQAIRESQKESAEALKQLQLQAAIRLLAAHQEATAAEAGHVSAINLLLGGYSVQDN